MQFISIHLQGKIFFTFLILITIFNFSIAQLAPWECYLDEFLEDSSPNNHNNPSNIFDCEKGVTSIVTNQALLNQLPDFTLNVNFHFIRNESGGENFDPVTPSVNPVTGEAVTGYQVAEFLLNKLNDTYDDLKPYELSHLVPFASLIEKPKIQFQLYSEGPNADPLDGVHFPNYSGDFGALGALGNSVIFDDLSVYGNKVLDIYLVSRNTYSFGKLSDSNTIRFCFMSW